jgi:replicative DNA helicase
VATAKLPPQNLEAEASLLGSILIDPEAINKVADLLEPNDFYDTRHVIIYESIVRLYEKRRPIDILTLSSQLSDETNLEQIGGATYITELTNYVPSAAHIEQYADIVKQKSLRRKLIKASQEIVELGYDEVKPMQDILETAETELFIVSKRNVKQDLVKIESILDESFERLDEMHKNKGKIRGVSSGLRGIDNILAGLNKSDLLILAARPAMGKSTLAVNIAHHVASVEKKTVLLFTLEMGKDQIVDRLLAAEAGVDSWKIRTGDLSEEDFERLGVAYGELAESKLMIDDTPGLSVSELRTKARREAHKEPLGLIVIDYLQLMSGGSRFSSSDNRVNEISEISRGLKGIARELDVPVLALSQLSRSVESRHPQIPQLSDLRESGSIEQDADVVMFIYREDYYNPETDRQHITDILVRKHRHGPTGNAELFFHDTQQVFRDIDRSRDGSAPKSFDD